MKRAFIINPKSGQGMSPREIEKFKRSFSRMRTDSEYLVSKSAQDLTDLTRQALAGGAQQIISVGGDGTMNAVMNGFFTEEGPIRTSASLGVCPRGTGCDYYKTIIEGSIVKDWKVIVHSPHFRFVDVGKISFADGRPSRYFLNMTGIGISSEIVQVKASSYFKAPGPFAYLWPTVRALLTYRSPVVKIKTDRDELETKVLAAFVAKGLYSGGGMKFGARAKLSDGFFDVTLIRPMPPLECLMKMGKVYSGNFGDEAGIQKMITRSITFSSDGPIPLEYDGEPCHSNEFTISVVEKALRVCFPLI